MTARNLLLLPGDGIGPEAMAEDISKLMMKVMNQVGSDMLAPVRVDSEAEISDSWGG